MKMKKLALFLIIFVISITGLVLCDLSGVLGIKKKPDEPEKSGANGFKSIIATTRPVFTRRLYKDWNRDEWLIYKNKRMTYNCYDSNGRVVTCAFSRLTEAVFERGRGCRGGYAEALRPIFNRLNAEPSRTFLSEPEVFYGDIATKRLGSNATIVNNFPTDEYSVPLGIIIESQTYNFGFRIRKNSRELSSCNSHSWISWGPFIYTVAKKNLFTPLNFNVFDSILLVVNDKAAIVGVYPYDAMTQSYAIEDNTVTITLKPHESTEVHVGDIADIAVRAENGTVRQHIIKLVSRL